MAVFRLYTDLRSARGTVTGLTHVEVTERIGLKKTTCCREPFGSEREVIEMFDLRSVPIPNYTRKEDIVNSATHAPGVLFAVVACLMSFFKLGGAITGAQLAAVLIYSVCTLILYFGSAYYHGVRPGFAKQVARVLDHSNVFLMITGSLSAFYLLGVIPVKRTLGIVLFVLSWVVTAVGILLTFMSQERFKAVQMALYMVLGWSALLGLNCVRTSCPDGRRLAFFVLLGGIVYSVGAVLYGVGKKVPYIHAVFHILILAGTVLQFYGIYEFAL